MAFLVLVVTSSRRFAHAVDAEIMFISTNDDDHGYAYTNFH
jgi:hypothetical protein